MNEIDRYTEMDEFIKSISILQYKNNDKILNRDIIYQLLNQMNFSSDQRLILNELNKYYRTNESVNVLVKEFFLYIFNYHIENETAIKLYIPLQKDKLEMGIKLLVDYLISESILFEVKVSSFDRNDNLVIRLTSLDDVDFVINLLTENPYLQESLKPCNPFLNTYKNFGITYEGVQNKPYTMYVCHELANYINYVKTYKLYKNASLNHFKLFLNSLNSTKNQMLKSILLYSVTPSKDNNEIIELINKYNPLLSKDDKLKLLIKAIKETDKKFDENAAYAGIKEYRDNDVIVGITNNENARINLIKNVKRTDIDILLDLYIEQHNLTIEKDKLKSVVTDITKIDINDMELLKNACEETTKKRGIGQTLFALRKLEINSASGFTNNNNARAMVEMKLLDKNIHKLLKESLLHYTKLKLKDINNAQDLAELYCETISDNK